MTTSSTAASVQFMTINQATVLIAAKGVMLGKVAEYLRKAGCKFNSTTLDDGRTQFNLLSYTEHAWRSINKKYKHQQINKPLLYISGGTFYKSKIANAYRLGLDQESHASVLNRIRKLGIQFTNITSWNDRLDGRVRIQFIALTQEQVKLLTEEYGGEMGCYVAINPNKPAPKKQAKPAAKENSWSWGTTDKVPTVTLEQLEAIAVKQPTPVEVQPDTDSTPSVQAPDTDSTPVKVQPDTDSTPSVNYAEKVANLATYHDFHRGVRKECVFQLGREHGFPSKNKGTICSKLVALQIYSKEDIKPLLYPGYQL